MRAANVAASPSRPSTIAKRRWARREASAGGTPRSRAGPARTDPPPADPRDGLRDHRLELSVVDGGPGRRLYDAAGFEIIARVLSIPLPREHSWTTHRCLMAGEGRLAGTKGSGPGSVLGRATGVLAWVTRGCGSATMVPCRAPFWPWASQRVDMRGG